MAELTQRAGLSPPEIEAGVGEVVVRFRPTAYVPPLRIGHDLTDLQRSILDVLSRTGPAPLGKILEQLPAGTSRRTVQDNLTLLYELGQADFSGAGRWRRWRLKGTPEGRA
jgi:ATP-dependent DNA helicase RecG